LADAKLVMLNVTAPLYGVSASIDSRRMIGMSTRMGVAVASTSDRTGCWMHPDTCAEDHSGGGGGGGRRTVGPCAGCNEQRERHQQPTQPPT